MKNAALKTRNLIEALPYIQKFTGKTFVIKFGGSILKKPAAKEAFIQDILLLSLVGIRPVIVHGGGSDITKKLEKLQIPTSFVNGLRVTDSEAMEEVEMILAGSINKDLVMGLQNAGSRAVGISGKDGGLLKAKRLGTLVSGEMVDLGFVGDIDTVDISLVRDLIELNYIPVIAPTGFDENGHTYNINADTAAAAISSSLGAEKLILLTDVDGLYLDYHDKSTLQTSLSLAEGKALIKDGIIKGGMLPKLQCALDALDQGAHSVHLINGSQEHGLLLEIFTDEGVGTMITKEGKK